MLISKVANSAGIPRDRPERLPRTLTRWRADFLGGAIDDDSGMAANGSSAKRILGSFRKFNCLVSECRHPLQITRCPREEKVPHAWWGERIGSTTWESECP